MLARPTNCPYLSVLASQTFFTANMNGLTAMPSQATLWRSSTCGYGSRSRPQSRGSNLQNRIGKRQTGKPEQESLRVWRLSSRRRSGSRDDGVRLRCTAATD
jgi:hypothetical protein